MAEKSTIYVEFKNVEAIVKACENLKIASDLLQQNKELLIEAISQGAAQTK